LQMRIVLDNSQEMALAAASVKLLPSNANFLKASPRVGR
jgi:hypothetical protein